MLYTHAYTITKYKRVLHGNYAWNTVYNNVVLNFGDLPAFFFSFFHLPYTAQLENQ